jgi:hypothetical protein
MASGTTNIFDLPSTNQNIQFSVTDNIAGQDTKLNPVNSGVTLDQTTINQIVSGIQQASVTGATQLQSRDIPTHKTQQLDNQVQQEYIPPPNNTNFVEEEDIEENNFRENLHKAKNYLYLFENTYNEIQMAVLLSIFYFLLQLPYIKKLLITYIPILFFKDGNINIYGNLFMSILFGIAYYVLSLFIHVNEREGEILYSD